MASSSSSPSIPTITTRSFVKSSTLTLANVLCPSTSSVPLINASPVAVKFATVKSVPFVLQLSIVSSQSQNTLNSSPRFTSSPTSCIGEPSNSWFISTIGSEIYILVVSIVVMLPLTSKLPSTTRSLLIRTSCCATTLSPLKNNLSPNLICSAIFFLTFRSFICLFIVFVYQTIKKPGSELPGLLNLNSLKLRRMLGLQRRFLKRNLLRYLVMMLCLLAQHNRNES